jgi:putative membrane protein
MDKRLITFFLLLLPVAIGSFLNPYDRFTWWLEVMPACIGLPLMVVVRKRFPLSTLLLVLVWLHVVVLLVGGHYTYARVPLFDWIRDACGGSRNNYDKLGHFVQGFVPAIMCREILLRTSPLGAAAGERFDPAHPRPSRWLGFLVGCVCLAFSALYELIEWLTAVCTGTAADDFLGTQGYMWDTQTDMAWALVGAVVALLACPKLHNRSLQKLLSPAATN